MIINAFFALLKAGLWEHTVRLLPFGPIDYQMLYELADQQAVVGLIVAGLEHVEDLRITKQEAVPFLKKVYSLESRNSSMNDFIGEMVSRMRKTGIYSILVKGQGVAQCYTRPQWRASGDVDFFFDTKNYQKAKQFFIPQAISVNEEDKHKLHLGMTIGTWNIELHGTMHTDLSHRINVGVDEAQKSIFVGGMVRVWENDGIEVFLPSPGDDVIIVFTHILEHFFVGGIGLRQICDWCRLLWTYKNEIDLSLLEHRLRKMAILSEWQAFASFAVTYLGMPTTAMPFYSDRISFKFKAERICRLILEKGNFGKNINQSYRQKYPKSIVDFVTFWRRLHEFSRLSIVFPLDGPVFFLTYLGRKISALIKPD